MKKEKKAKVPKTAEKGTTRRRFLKGAAYGAAVTAGASLLLGCNEDSDAGDCTPKECEGPKTLTWDKETDVVVVGGGTGLTAALAAAVSGAEVILLEKSAEVGGSTKLSGGVMWIPNNPVMKAKGIEDSREMSLKYLTKVSKNQADISLVEASVDKGPEMVTFLEEHTELKFRVSTLLGDYHPEWEGGIIQGRSIEPDASGFFSFGPVLIDGLAKGFTDAGGEILVNTPAKSLVTRLLDTGVQEILGVVAESEGKTIRIKARKGVVLAAGGFEWDPELKRHFLRGPSVYSLGHTDNTGDGLRMGMAAGVDLRNMNEVWGMVVFKEEAEELRQQDKRPGLSAVTQRRMPGSITVNRYGKRFSNEASDYDSAWLAFWGWENFGDVLTSNLPAYQITDKRQVPKASVGVKQADTIRELAEQLGIDPDALEATVNEFNENAAEGKDPLFHRGESAYEKVYGATLGAVDEAPFYGIEVAPADIGTAGGVRVNANAQALNPFGLLVPRLYSSGNNAGVGGPGALYAGGGGTIGPAMTFAYIAGMHVATLENQTD